MLTAGSATGVKVRKLTLYYINAQFFGQLPLGSFSENSGSKKGCKNFQKRNRVGPLILKNGPIVRNISTLTGADSGFPIVEGAPTLVGEGAPTSDVGIFWQICM